MCIPVLCKLQKMKFYCKKIVKKIIFADKKSGTVSGDPGYLVNFYRKRFIFVISQPVTS